MSYVIMPGNGTCRTIATLFQSQDTAAGRIMENDKRCVLGGGLVWLARAAGVVCLSLVFAAGTTKVAGIGRLRRLAGRMRGRGRPGNG